MINALLERWNNARRKKYFHSVLFQSEKKYAFVGAGMHSLVNLYPVLRQGGVSLKLIYTQTSADAALQRLFPGCRFTHDLQDILSDPEIEGVFVSASPAAHAGILSALLTAGKKVFIEKPPCQDLKELRQLAGINPAAVCKVGLQRRSWPGNLFLTSRIKKAISYRYIFHTGSFIQGDALTELFIHPLDYCLFLFGPLANTNMHIHRDKNGITIQLQVKHVSGVTGQIELSTLHSWNAPVESLAIDCPRESLQADYPALLKGDQKPRRLLNIPTERVLNTPEITKTYFSSKHLRLPVADLNTLVLQGFYQELETFVALVEGKSTAAEKNDLAGLIPLYELFEKIKSDPAY